MKRLRALSGGLWFERFTKTVAYRKVSAEGTESVAPAAGSIAENELMLSHGLTCRIREERVDQQVTGG